MTAPSLPPDTRVLRLHLTGVLDLAIPPRLNEDGADWEAWFEEALAAAFEDGGWAEASSITRSEIGHIDAHGRFRPVA